MKTKIIKTKKLEVKKSELKVGVNFSKDSIKFLSDLEKNNNRNWFLENKEKYIQLIKSPLLSLAEDLRKDFGEAHVYRPNRDMRFSKDKKPYKTQASFYIEIGVSGYYFQIDKNSILIGGGLYNPEKDQLLNFRNIFNGENLNTQNDAIKDSVNKNAASIDRVIKNLNKIGFELMGQNDLKTAPRGFDKNSQYIKHLQKKSLAMSKTYELGEFAYTADLLKIVKSDFKILREWNEIINKNVGPTKIVRTFGLSDRG